MTSLKRVILLFFVFIVVGVDKLLDMLQFLLGHHKGKIEK